MLEACLSDKKATGSAIRIIVPERIGPCRIQRIPTEELARWLALGGVN